jgi:hypothetical protein
MSEYVEIETETGDEPGSIIVTTNVRLSEGQVERYDSVAALEVGSPLAQALAYVPGIRRLHLGEYEIVVWHDPAMPTHVIVADISAAIRDFFL